MIYPSRQFKELSKECQELVEGAIDDPDKQFEVGHNLINGEENFPRNTKLGIKYLEQSIENGSIEGVVCYSDLLIKGNLIPPDLEKAKSLLADHLDSENSSILYLYGKVNKKESNFADAKKYFEKASKLGSPEAMYEYGKLLYKGQGCTKNENEAQKYFTLAKNNGIKKSDKYLSKSSSEKVEIPEEDDNTVNHCINLAKKGDIDAMYNCGVMYYEGKETEKNVKLSGQYFKQAADKGHVKSMSKYGGLIINKEIDNVEEIEALPYIKRAAENGDVDGLFLYGKVLSEGRCGVPANYKDAAKYYKLAADKGDSDAACNLAGLILSKFEPTNKNILDAKNYLKMAVDKDNDKAMVLYGFYYCNADEGNNYFKKAADLGNEEAKSILAKRQEAASTCCLII